MPESTSQDRLLLIRQLLLQGLLGHSLPNALWLSPAPSQNFHGNFAKVPLSADPISRGRIRGKARGLGAWLLQSLTFGSLAAACEACFLRLQKATLGGTCGRCKDVLQDHGIWLWRRLTFGSLAATYEGKGKCAVPFPDPRTAGGGSS